MTKAKKYSVETRERAVRLVFDHESEPSLPTYVRHGARKELE